MILKFIPLAEIRRIRNSILDPLVQAQILANIFRLNTLSMITEAGSGHIGTSFSCLDIIAWLWLREMKNTNETSIGANQNSDTFFSSKGHDVPALYALLIGLEKIEYHYIHKLRRLNGLPGHPDISIPYIAANTGSLGMGISKARGMAEAYRLQGKQGRFYVLMGDGELQEGQVWESLQPTANHNFSEITVIVDHNKIQSDTLLSNTSDLGAIENKFRAFNWEVARCDGHNFSALRDTLRRLATVQDKPKILIADTIKGKGVSFMERLADDSLYKFHSGAPTESNYALASAELINKINDDLVRNQLAVLSCEETLIPVRITVNKTQKLVPAHAQELVKIGKEHGKVVVLDADLMVDTGVYPFHKDFPERHIECGIAEQDMVSMAGGLALKGLLPIVHSFACFLSTRANEQIYTNATEQKKIIYVGALAGLLPAGPGHSHQSVRDISALGSVPGLVMIQPGTEDQVRRALRWAVEENKQSTYIRLANFQTELPFASSDDALRCGQGRQILAGEDLAIFAYGPVMLKEAYNAAQLLQKEGISLAVYDMPWLNRVDKEWLWSEAQKYKILFTLDDHYIALGQGSMVAAALAQWGVGKKVINFGIEEIPACGQADEVLAYHKLDASSIADRIKGFYAV